jgi:Zn-dependent protease
VSLLLGVAFSLMAWLVDVSGVRGLVVVALAWLGGINIVLAVFNVIPAAPLDGGRLLRAVLWRIDGDRLKAAVFSARSGQVFGWALVVVGGFLVLARRDYT